jgi:predicted dehydrogenase
MKPEKRREFIKKSAVVSAGLAVGVPAFIKGFSQRKPSDVINVAVAGIGGRGGYYGGSGHTAFYTKIKNSRVVAICDVDENLFPKATADIEKLGGTKPRTVVDFRDLLDDQDIDVISIATPDHWHALQTIWACQAGKDVYVEKPLAHTIEEGRRMVQAARKYDRIVQVGTQHRSNRVSQKGIRLLQEGVIGDIYMGRSNVYGHRPSIGRVGDSPVPAGVHWDLHRGPAPMIPFNQNHFHYKWHWYWDTATGEFGNNGVHGIDRIRLGMKKYVHPRKISCCGGFYAWDSDQEVPNLQVATFEYEDGTILEMEVRSLFTPSNQDGLLFLGSEGYAQLGYRNFRTFLGSEREPGPSVAREDIEKTGTEEAGIDPHFVNFLDCVRSRNWKNLVADVLEGHLSTTITHLGNIAYRTGRKLVFDNETEKFVNDTEADSYLTREYREPYVLPTEV